jgi:hypothetical protein
MRRFRLAGRMGRRVRSVLEVRLARAGRTGPKRPPIRMGPTVQKARPARRVRSHRLAPKAPMHRPNPSRPARRGQTPRTAPRDPKLQPGPTARKAPRARPTPTRPAPKVLTAPRAPMRRSGPAARLAQRGRCLRRSLSCSTRSKSVPAGIHWSRCLPASARLSSRPRSGCSHRHGCSSLTPRPWPRRGRLPERTRPQAPGERHAFFVPYPGRTA